MISPPYLSIGDKVAIVSTARKIEETLVQTASSFIESWGLKVVTAKNLFNSSDQFAGTDEERLEDLQWALESEEIKAIFCARGGYGTVRLIDNLDFSKFTNHPKWILGYSDVTVLHAHLQQVLGIESIHSSMPVNFPDNSSRSLSLIRSALFGDSIHYSFPGHELNRIGEAQGEIIGGNLSILYSLNGSESMPNSENKILFLEDLDEYLYHVDRMMMNLKRSGFLSSLAGIVVGHMSDMNDNEIPFGENALEIIRRNVEEYDYPVVFSFPAGHDNDNQPLILGRKVELTVDEKSSLIFSS